METNHFSTDGQVPMAKQPKAIQLKTSVAQDDMQPSLVKLNRDILIMIFDLLQETSKGSLQAVALVSIDFYHLAEHSRHRHLRLDLGPSTIAASQNRLQHLERQKLLAAVRFLDVKDPGFTTFKHGQQYIADNSSNENINQYTGCLDLIRNLIPAMTGLKDVSWKSSAHGDGNIPNTLLEALRSDSKVRLHAKVGTQTLPVRHGFTGPESNFHKLQNNTNLSKLEAEIVYKDDTDCLEATKPLKRILLSCPNIRSLSLDISLPQSGCMVYGPPDKYCGFGFVENEKLPPLEELAISAYLWGHEPSGVQDPVYGGQMIGYPGKGSEMKYWTENFDWSRLRRLKTAYVDFALKIMPMLTALKEVDFSGSGSDDDVVRFYQQCPTALEVIGAESLQSITLDGVLRHGRALRKLQLHTVEDWGGE